MKFPNPKMTLFLFYIAIWLLYNKAFWKLTAESWGFIDCYRIVYSTIYLSYKFRCWNSRHLKITQNAQIFFITPTMIIFTLTISVAIIAKWKIDYGISELKSHLHEISEFMSIITVESYFHGLM